ncbi:MAG: MFS transporter [Oscillospiraceae bacterium]|nr:MFS transporter [Oscillospiraceae bacterium]
MAEQQKLNYKKTILIGFGFMATSVVWGIYDPYITKILNAMLSDSAQIAHWSDALIARFPALLDFMRAQGENVENAGGGFTLVPLFIGLIMTFDNVFGVIFQPAFGKISDRTHSRFGKRSPYIYIGAPISAVLFALIPWMFVRFDSLFAVMVCVILFVLVMSLWRAPVVALMPDLTPPKLRSEGNAIINLCGGVGGLLGMLSGTVILAVMKLLRADVSDETKIFPYVFLFGSFVMVVCTLILFFFVKEPDSRLKVVAERNKAMDEHERHAAQKQAEKEEKKQLKSHKLSKAERISLIFMLMGLFFLFCGTNAIQTFFALFADEILHKSTSQATFMMAVFAICSMLTAIPAGKLGKRFGRKKTILLGLVLFMSVFVLYLLTKQMTLVWVALIVGGAANMLITVNTLPLVLEIGGIDKVGTFTGYYYTATFSAQIAAPILFGMVRMFSGTYMSLFVFSPVAFVLSLLCISMVRHGEAVPDHLVKEAQMADD